MKPMSESTIHIRFPGLSPMAAGQAAADLAEFLKRRNPEVSAKPARTDPNPMDMGPTLALLPGTPALIAVGEGIGAWLSQGERGEVDSQTPDGRIVAKGLGRRATREAVREALALAAQEAARRQEG